MQPHNELEIFQMQVIIPDCDYKRFEEIPYYRLRPASNHACDTAKREADIIYYVVNWCHANANLIGHYTSSQSCYTLPDIVNDLKSTILVSPLLLCLVTDGMLYRNQTFAAVTPNFILELRSHLKIFTKKFYYGSIAKS
ncbi:3309_t:CDS:2, partial [Diversispora eburnea]